MSNIPRTKGLPLRVFVGSSDAQRPLATRVVDALSPIVTPVPWWKAFQAGETTLGNLLHCTREIDLAVFIVSPDDLRWKGHDSTKESSVVRDNVVFELGLFAGALGPKRSIMFLDKALIPDRPTDLSGVTEVPWNSKGDLKSFDEGIASIIAQAHSVFDNLGLGWWAIRFDNDARPGRATYGIFEIGTEGSQLIVCYGNTYYSAAAKTEMVSHQHRSTWESRTATFVHGSKGQSRLVVLADVTSLAPPADPEHRAREAARLQTLFEIHKTGEDNTYHGRYFDVQGLDYFGRVAACRLKDFNREEALEFARTRFGGVVV